jgi:OOP family OmpA-OmpF porin
MFIPNHRLLPKSSGRNNAWLILICACCPKIIYSSDTGWTGFIFPLLSGYFLPITPKKENMDRRIILMMFVCSVTCLSHAQVTNPNQVAKDAATNHANNDMNNAADKGLNKAEQGINTLFKKKNKDKKQDTAQPAAKTAEPAATEPTAPAQTPDQPAAIKVYQNYDFVPGEKILFDDNFQDDQDGEFPAHWRLTKGQAVVNKVEGKPAFLLTEGNYAVVSPRMKTDKYLGSDFTLEFDFIFKPDKDGGVSYGTGVEFLFNTDGYDQRFRVSFNEGDVSIGELDKSYPAELANDFINKWHHAAIIRKNGQMKAYVDQYRVCVNPDTEQKFNSIEFDGIGDETKPIVFTNVKLAEGGGMNVIGQKFTDAKIVTHGINFEIDKAGIRPESMGTLNMIVRVLKDNPAIKFEIEGHTDNTGGAAHNLALSQQRADAVKKQLVTMGVDAARLTTKGFGDTKPLSDNSTPEGKANNRRVEFVKR